jgi:hypothetical protein
MRKSLVLQGLHRVKLKYLKQQPPTWGVLLREDRVMVMENLIEIGDYSRINQNNTPHSAESITWS